MEERKKVVSPFDAILNEIHDSQGGLTAEDILSWCDNQYTTKDDRKNLDELKNILNAIVIASQKNSLLHNNRLSHLSAEDFIIQVFDEDSIAYINEPDQGQEFNVPEEVAEKGEELTPEQEAKNKSIETYQDEKDKQTFFAQLMRKILADAINKKKESLSWDWVPKGDNNKNPLATIFPALNPKKKGENKAAILIDKISAFQNYADKLRADHELVAPVSHEEKAEERHIFKAEARMYDLLIHPQDQSKQDACVKLSKKLTGHLNWKYIGIGILLIAIAATIIGVTCGAAAGAFALLGIGVASWIGISTMVGFLTTALTIGYKGIVGSKPKKDSPLMKIPVVGPLLGKIPPVKGLKQGLPHGLSFRFHAVAKAADPKKNPNRIDGMQAVLDVLGKNL